jgi:hypothetical protein
VIIKLELPKTKVISGYDFGKKVFNEQVKDKIEYTNLNQIVLDESIEIIGISFVQGFTHGIFHNIPKHEFSRVVEIIGNEKLKNRFLKAIKY